MDTYLKVIYNSKENAGFLMQYQKDEVRNSIIEEALKQFDYVELNDKAEIIFYKLVDEIM